MKERLTNNLGELVAVAISADEQINTGDAVYLNSEGKAKPIKKQAFLKIMSKVATEDVAVHYDEATATYSARTKDGRSYNITEEMALQIIGQAAVKGIPVVNQTQAQKPSDDPKRKYNFNL